MLVSIDKYLLSTCLFIIDEFNEMYKNINSKQKLKEIADTDYSEADLVVRLGYPFRQMANFTMQGNSGNDIVVKSKDFRIEVKYLKNWTNPTSIKKSRSNKITWEQIEKDFNWLSGEIVRGEKGKRAFVLGWFNSTERFTQLIQLGEGNGRFPKLSYHAC